VVSERPSVALRRLVNGYQVTQAIHVVAVLGIADLLAEGARDARQLAAATGVQPRALYRVLRALAAAGVMVEHDDERFSLTEMGECLRDDAAEPVGGWAAFVGGPEHWAAWGQLEYSVRSGQSGYVRAHGAGPWEHRAEHPEAAAVFDRAMADTARRMMHLTIDAYDFARFGTVVDVGGGRGALLATLLAANPQMRGVLFDLPHVVAAADPGDRCEIIGGSFFDAVPEGGDAYLLRAVLHDWGDEDAVRILRRCREAMAGDATLLILERDLGGANERMETKLSDLNMLVGPGGEERSIGEYAALMAQAGFGFSAATPAPFEQAVIEGRPT
jgi:hypothetical protein